jgi:RsiW-degrading membrane proteinase PrsW (M82 family)
MSGFGVLIILIFISSIPAIAVFIWFRFARYPFSLPRFSFSLLAGAIAFFPALFLQNIFSAGNKIFFAMGKWGLIAEIFVRIAFTEEFSRLMVLIILFSAIHRWGAVRQRNADLSVNISADTMASASGLIAGLGFAILESAVYGASNPGNALLRIFTAAPLHGACGFRAGSSVAMFPEHPVQAVFRFLSAIVIHGIYNFMLIIPGIFPSITAILIALSALAASVIAIRSGMKGEAA